MNFRNKIPKESYIFIKMTIWQQMTFLSTQEGENVKMAFSALGWKVKIAKCYVFCERESKYV